MAIYPKCINYGLTRPCTECPMLIDSPIKLPEDRMREIIISVVEGGACFPCHKTTDMTGDNTSGINEHTHYCAGMLIALAKADLTWANLYNRLAFALHKFNPHALDMSAETIDIRCFT